MNPYKKSFKYSKEELQQLFPFLENAVMFNRYWLSNRAKDGSQLIRIKYQLDKFSPLEWMEFSSTFLLKEYEIMMRTNINSTS